ncbi:MAG TPA: gliding motility-associated C-terminal domain-containing protein, partial [Chitinophagaceae bacterium]|nr:gliding motility-associated C-terminal domain-containing protein [Chitinophagaceae bacterium]
VQGSVTLCGNTPIPVPACNNGTVYTNINPYWYKFTCYTAGTLDFLITPNNLSDDYDWQIFDITNSKNPDYDIFNDKTLFVDCNWSGVTGLTGTADTASAPNQCSSPTTYAAGGVSPFSKSPNLIQGHTYLLLVSHFTNTQSGYSLSFTGGTASITDPNIPTYLNASGMCGGNKVYIKLNKTIQCKTLDADGSDFKITPSTVSITGASGYSCLTSFDTDSIIVQLSNPLAANNYTIFQQVGNDGNTLMDNCNNPVAVGDNKSFVITNQQLIKASFKLQLNYGCKIDTALLHLTGQNMSTWTWYVDGVAKNGILIDTSIYYTFYGAHNIKLVAQNSVCIDSTAVSFNLSNAPVKAIFAAPDFACPSDTIQFINNSIGNIRLWDWDFSNGQTSNLQNPPAQIYPPGSNLKYYPVRLTVTDSIGCSDTTYKSIQVAPNCYIAVPTAFTPNGDGLNDYLYPLNAYKATNLLFRVFNRYGQMIFETRDWTVKWNGSFKNIPQPSGTYVWTLDFTEPATGKKIAQKGTTVLIR